MKIKTNRLLATAMAFAVACTLFLAVPLFGARADEAADPCYGKGEQFDVYTSSTIKDYTDDTKQAKHMIDGNNGSFWCSAWVTETTSPCNEWVLFDFHEIVKIESLTLTACDTGFMFPDAFSFSWSTSNEVEIAIAGQDYRDYENAADNVNVFTFETPVVARYIKMTITSRTPDSGGIHLVRIAEAAAKTSTATAEEKAAASEKDAAAERPLVVNDPVLAYTVSASSFLDDHDNWLPEHLTDNNITTQWCSEWVGTTTDEAEIYVTMTVGDPQKVSGVIITSQLICFPADFTFQYTMDGNNWVDIANASYQGFEVTPGQNKYVFPFEGMQVATAVRIKITRKTADPSGNYLVQFADLDVRGFAATEEEIAAATEAFNTAIGNLPQDPNQKPKPIPATPEDFRPKEEPKTGGCKSALGGGFAALGAAAVLAAAVLMKRKEGRYE